MRSETQWLCEHHGSGIVELAAGKALLELELQGLVRLVATLVDDEEGQGFHSVVWNAAGQASGVYFIRMSTPAFTQTRKTLLMK